MAVDADRPYTVISGGGQFYCFYVEDWQFQSPPYRHLLINGSTSGLRFYHSNGDSPKSDAAFEVANSANVSFFGIKSEGNNPVLVIRQAQHVLLTGFGGLASAYPLNGSYPATHEQFTPALVRVEASTDVTLAHIWPECRLGDSGGPFDMFHYSPAVYSAALWKNDTVIRRGGSTLPPLERPVVLKL